MGQNPLQTVREVFTRWAPHYDATHAWTLPYRRQARLALGVRPGDRVLDLACGTGLNFAHLRQLAGDSGRIVGADLTPAMLDIARRRIEGQGWRNVAVAEADAAHLPFAAGEFDLAICTFAMAIIPEYDRAIAEVARVLAPGGRFAVLDVQAGNRPLVRWLAARFKGGMGMCAVDLSHQTIPALRRIFPQVQVREYWGGLVYIALATRS